MALDRKTFTSPPSDTTFAFTQIETNEEIVALWQGVTLPLILTNALPDSITATCVPPLTAYTDTMHFTLITAMGNTGAMTLSIDGLGTRPLVSSTNTNLTAGQILPGQMLQVAYDTSINAFRVVGGLAPGTTLPAPTQQWQVLQADITLTPTWNLEMFSGNF